jgi:hypothetical protein
MAEKPRWRAFLHAFRKNRDSAANAKASMK